MVSNGIRRVQDNSVSQVKQGGGGDLIFFKCISVSNNYYCSRKIALIATLRLQKKSWILVTGTKTFKDYNALLEYGSSAGIKFTSWI